MQGASAFGIVLPGVEIGHAHAAQAQGRYSEAGAAQLAGFHMVVWWSGEFKSVILSRAKDLITAAQFASIHKSSSRDKVLRYAQDDKPVDSVF
ncbi:hypothetical protein GCM10027044_39840 [Hymenobacter ruber]